MQQRNATKMFCFVPVRRMRFIYLLSQADGPHRCQASPRRPWSLSGKTAEAGAWRPPSDRPPLTVHNGAFVRAQSGRRNADAQIHMRSLRDVIHNVADLRNPQLPTACSHISPQESTAGPQNIAHNPQHLGAIHRPEMAMGSATGLPARVVEQGRGTLIRQIRTTASTPGIARRARCSRPAPAVPGRGGPGARPSGGCPGHRAGGRRSR